MIVIRVAANTPPAPKRVKKAIIRKSLFVNKPIVFALITLIKNRLFLERFLLNLRKVNTLNDTFKVMNNKQWLPI